MTRCEYGEDGDGFGSTLINWTPVVSDASDVDDVDG